MKYLLFFISLAAFAQVPRPGAWQTPAGGPIGGASSVATGQVLYGTGAGVAGSENTFVWDAANDRLGVGTNAPGLAFDLRSAASGLSAMSIRNTNASGYSAMDGFDQSGTIQWSLGSGNSGVGVFNGLVYLAARGTFPLTFATNGTTERARFAPTTGNLLLGTTTDGNFRLDIGSSGSAGTARFYNQDIGGATQVVVRAGDTQGSTALVNIQAAAGAPTLWRIDGIGNVIGDNAAANYLINPSTGVAANSTWRIAWSSSSNSADAKDLGIYRNAAGVLEINNGTAGTFRDLTLRAVTSSGYAFASLPAATNGTFLYCSDCTIASPCASGGTGALAKRLNSTWVCD